MKPGGGKRKGGRFERQICRDLSYWISGGERDDVFWRTAMSGGRATLGLRQDLKRSSQAGDVQPINELGMEFSNKFVVECKRVKSLQIDSWMLKGTGNGAKFWREHRIECNNFDRLPFMVGRQDNCAELLFLVSNYEYNHLIADLRIGVIEYYEVVDGGVMIGVDKINIIDWQRFLNNVSPDDFIGDWSVSD